MPTTLFYNRGLCCSSPRTMSHASVKIAYLKLPHSPELAVRSHGWPVLAPYTLENRTLLWATDLPERGPSQILLKWGPGGLSITVFAQVPLSKADVRFVKDTVRWMFRGGEDLSDFWQLCRSDPVLRQCAESRAGVLMRSATTFEDVVKTFCTINCHWRNTKRMVARLCSQFGKPCGYGVDGATLHTFPTAEDLARATMPKLKSAGLGYRADYVREFARSVSSGRLRTADWLRVDDIQALRRSLLDIRGIGPYGADHIIMLLSRYDFVPCDSEVCAYLGFPSRTKPSVLETAIRRRYGRWGKYAFLAFKFERHFQNSNYVDC